MWRQKSRRALVIAFSPRRFEEAARTDGNPTTEEEHETMSKQQSLPVTPEFVFVHFPATDDRFNGTRTAIVASRGPKWIGLIVLECATLTVTRLDAALEKSCVKPIPATEFNAPRALETFRAMARKMGASKVVCDALGIEWPPADPTQALATFERHAQTIARNNLNEEDETMTTKTPAAKKAAPKKTPATKKAPAKSKASQKPQEASQAPRASVDPLESFPGLQAKLGEPEAKPKAPRATKTDGPVHRIRRATPEIAARLGLDLAKLDRKQAHSILETLQAELPDLNVATIRTQFQYVRRNAAAQV